MYCYSLDGVCDLAKITCTMCGHVFDPAEYTSCAGCPLQKGCQLVCCPVCGFEMVDPQQSVLARLVMNFLEHKRTQKMKKIGERSA